MCHIRKSKPKDVLAQPTQMQKSMESNMSASAAQPDDKVFEEEYKSNVPANSAGLANVSHV